MWQPQTLKNEFQMHAQFVDHKLLQKQIQFSEKMHRRDVTVTQTIFIQWSVHKQRELTPFSCITSGSNIKRYQISQRALLTAKLTNRWMWSVVLEHLRDLKASMSLATSKLTLSQSSATRIGRKTLIINSNNKVLCRASWGIPILFATFIGFE